MADPVRVPRGPLDTSVVMDIENIDVARLSRETAIRSLTMAELAAGPHATDDPGERGHRRDRLQCAESVFESLAFDGDAARAYGRNSAAVAVTGRKARGARAVALLIAATAVSEVMPLCTRNGADFEGLEGLVVV